MARSRNIKPGFFKNEVLSELPCEVRLLFIGLWTLADREGRLEDRPKRIKVELFAYDSFDVGPMLDRLQADGFLRRYEAGGQRLIAITNFVKHQDPHYKEKASELPAPPGEEDQIVACNVTRSQRARIFERDGFSCCQCGSKEGLCIDHILPVSRGGDSSDENLQTLCSPCNTKKGNKLAGEIKNTTKRPAPVIPPQPNLSSDQRRPDVESTQVLHDPLIPDSLIPDSLIPSNPPLPPVAGGKPPEDPPRQRRTRKPRCELKTYVETCDAEGREAIGLDDPVFAYAEQIALPVDMLELAWQVFRDKLWTGKQQASWPQTFRNYVQGNYLKLWYQGESGWALTTAGKQAKLAYGGARAAA